MSTVLVTGGSVFVGCHLILQLLEAGHGARRRGQAAAGELGLVG